MRLFDREHFALVYMSVFPYELNIASKKYNCSPVDGSSLCMITISYICKSVLQSPKPLNMHGLFYSLYKIMK